MPGTSSSTRRRAIALAMLAIVSTTALSSCGTAFRAERSRAPAATRAEPCPPLADYDAGEQARGASEYRALPDDAMLRRMIDDYLLLRDQCRRDRP